MEWIHEVQWWRFRMDGVCLKGEENLQRSINNPARSGTVKTYTLPETNIARENGWLEYDRFLLG